MVDNLNAFERQVENIDYIFYCTEKIPLRYAEKVYKISPKCWKNIKYAQNVLNIIVYGVSEVNFRKDPLRGVKSPKSDFSKNKYLCDVNLKIFSHPIDNDILNIPWKFDNIFKKCWISILDSLWKPCRDDICQK